MAHIAERVMDVIAESLGLPGGKVRPQARIGEDLGADELDRIDLVIALEEEFSIAIDDEDVEMLATVASIIACIERKLATEGA
jgi:acyl carrier protein